MAWANLTSTLGLGSLVPGNGQKSRLSLPKEMPSEVGFVTEEVQRALGFEFAIGVAHTIGKSPEKETYF